MSIDEKLKKEEVKKGHFLVLLYNRSGNISKACQDLRITRRKLDEWLHEDEDFAQDCLYVEESLIDMTQDMLIRNIKEGKSSDIQFFLKTKGKHRGYGEQVEVKHSGLIAHAHGVRHYPAEPKSIAEWEQQVLEAEQARPELIADTQGQQDQVDNAKSTRSDDPDKPSDDLPGNPIADLVMTA